MNARAVLFVGAVLMVALRSAASSAGEAEDVSGKGLYRHFCVSCHGDGAQGDGPVAPYMRTQVPDLTLIAKRNGGTFPAVRVRQVIDGQAAERSHGPRDMPVWGWEFYATDGEDAPRRRQVSIYLDRLTGYLQSLQRK